MLWDEFSNSWAEFSLAIRIDRIVLLKEYNLTIFFKCFATWCWNYIFAVKEAESRSVHILIRRWDEIETSIWDLVFFSSKLKLKKMGIEEQH